MNRMNYFTVVCYQAISTLHKLCKTTPLRQFPRKYTALPKRFYRNVSIVSNGNNSYEVTLDQKKVKTPQGNTLKLYNETLAYAVAAEWDIQKDVIQKSSMHLTALCNTVIDNPNRSTKAELIKHLISFLNTDTILYYSAEDNELYRLQHQVWTPVINWFNRKFEVNICPARNILGPVFDEHAKHILDRYLNSYSLPCIHGLIFGVENLYSIILTLCCLDEEISIEKAVLLSRLEEEFQTKNWGRVEWVHDVKAVDCQSRIAAALMFIRLNSESNKESVKVNIQA